MPPNRNPMRFYFGSLFIDGREIQEPSWRPRPEFVEKDHKHESYVDYSQYMRRYPPPEQFGQTLFPTLLPNQANRHQVADLRSIPVITNGQLEELADLQSRAIQREVARVRIEETIACAIADLDAAMSGIPDSSAFLARWRGRWSRLRLR
ncbi:hypothetical protein N7505_002841 [Penicillium chrysogenum]|uniref:Uncharacterized protein n=1 Tax=Penicillium chrysogenum TaxID=5076 RepID=A0ABQ8WNQ6_PENCH|nr:hypothetical protein N7505_002841 [Penicillium chrysogenum]